MGFFLLSRRKNLVISTPTGSKANGIDGSTVYTAFGINNRAKKTTSIKLVYNSHIGLD